jgi:hypothetical protein
MGVGFDSEGKSMVQYLHEKATNKRQNNGVYPTGNTHQAQSHCEAA